MEFQLLSCEVCKTATLFETCPVCHDRICEDRRQANVDRWFGAAHYRPQPPRESPCPYPTITA